MYKLLNAGFSRLRKNKVLFCLIIITIGIALFFVLNDVKYKKIDCLSSDKSLLNYINIVGLFMSLFTSLFIGVEYDYGTIRNKIIVGHSRTSIYLTNLIISIVIGVFLELIYMITIVAFGVPLKLNFEVSFLEYVIILLEIIFVITSYSSIFTLISFTCSNVTFSTTACMLLLFVMYVVCFNLAYPVNMPEYITNSYYDEQGIEHITESIPNPNYPSKEKMFIYKNIYYTIPVGQALEIAEKAENVDKINLFSYSAVFSGIVNIIGIFIFNKKDLK